MRGLVLLVFALVIVVVLSVSYSKMMLISGFVIGAPTGYVVARLSPKK